MANGGLPPEWEALSHSARIRKAIEVGRGSRSDASAGRLLRDWGSGGFTQRLLATYACHGSRDSAALLTLTADPSRTIARVAMSVMCDVGDEDDLLAALRNLPTKRADRALFRLRRPRQGVVDRFVSERAAEGDVTAWPLVPLGSSAVLERYFAPAAERGGDVFWRRLAVMHPARASAEILARLGAASNVDGLLFSHARIVVTVLSDRDPDVALTVVAALRRHVPLSTIPLQTLVTRRPVIVADLVIGSSEPVAACTSSGSHTSSTCHASSGSVRRGAGYLDDPGSWLARLPAPDREAIFRELAPAWTDDDGVIAATVLRRLSAPTRQREARWVVGLPVLATRPLQRLPFVGLLPWDEARAEAAPWLGHPEAEYRAAALVALCEASRDSTGASADLLELLIARKYEQDPVRLAFLGALSALPPGRWKAGHLSEARAAHPRCTRCRRPIVSEASPHSAGSSASFCHSTRLGRRAVGGGHARARLSGLVRQDADGRGRAAIAPTLTPVAEKWLNRENEVRVIALCVRGRPPATRLAGVVGFLERLIRTGRDHTAASAMSLIAQHVPAERERVITAALAKDESWVLASSGDGLPARSAAGSAHAVPWATAVLRPVQHREGQARTAADVRILPLDRLAAGGLRRVARGVGETSLAETGRASRHGTSCSRCAACRPCPPSGRIGF